MRPSFTDRELDLMAVLWERGPSTVAEVRERLPDALAHTTVQTVLRVLEDKGFVARTEEGRAHRYRAIVKPEVAGTNAGARIIETMFGGSTERFLTHFVNERRIAPDELRRLRVLLDERLAAEDK
jgi:predicted transcriptional regulator